MTNLWLRVALGLYSVGLLHAVLTVIKRRERLFRVGLGALSLGIVFHLVALVEDGLAVRHFPITSPAEAASLVGFVLAGAFLLVYWKYQFHSISVFVFPLVFVLTLTAAMERSDNPWGPPQLRTAWLLLH